MLKIKDNVSAEELEKFGFHKIDSDEQKISFYDEDGRYSDIRVWDKEIFVEGEVYDEGYDVTEMAEKLYDLIQAGLVEKVED